METNKTNKVHVVLIDNLKKEEIDFFIRSHFVEFLNLKDFANFILRKLDHFAFITPHYINK